MAETNSHSQCYNCCHDIIQIRISCYLVKSHFSVKRNKTMWLRYISIEIPLKYFTTLLLNHFHSPLIAYIIHNPNNMMRYINSSIYSGLKNSKILATIQIKNKSLWNCPPHSLQFSSIQIDNSTYQEIRHTEHHIMPTHFKIHKRFFKEIESSDEVESNSHSQHKPSPLFAVYQKSKEREHDIEQKHKP